MKITLKDGSVKEYAESKSCLLYTSIISGLSSGWYITKKAWDDPDKRAAAVSFISDMTTDENVSPVSYTHLC